MCYNILATQFNYFPGSVKTTYTALIKCAKNAKNEWMLYNTENQ